MSSSDPQARALSDRRLTRLLARWADARRLDQRQSETIRLAARATPAGLGFDWWWRLLDPDNGSVFRVTATRSAFAGAPGPIYEPPFVSETPGFTAWPQDAVEYQPYLRLI